MIKSGESVFSADNPLILDDKNWTGQNLLGKALMDVRKKLANA
jgi:predicted NAD-dependent protein-ADP-ribosyltransferase YbiA (DUF1768 family)